MNLVKKARRHVEPKPCFVCGGPVEIWARPQDPAVPWLCDACQRANLTPRRPS